MTSTLIQIQCTVPSREAGKKIARALVEEHLVACVNMLPKLQSFYIYEGAFCEEEELLLLIKTEESRYGAVEKCIIELHPYTVPEIIALNVTKGSQSYLEWAAESLTQIWK